MKSFRSLMLLGWLLSLSPALAADPPNAVVVVSVATVHKTGSMQAENVTQVPLGDHVKVLKTNGLWSQVYVTDQYRLAEGYPGWMLRSQLGREMPDKYVSDVLVVVPKTPLRKTPAGMALTHAYLGTHLEATGETSGPWMEVFLPGTQKTAWVERIHTSAATLTPTGADVVRTAEGFKGTPYVWGGISQEGIDCSGLTFMVYRIYGIELPRDADQQFEMGVAVSKPHLAPGDLVFYGKSADHITHVGLYKGHGLIVEASSSGGATRVSRLDHRTDYQGARRVIGVPLSMPPPSP